MSVRSPITGLPHVRLEQEIPSQEIISCYRDQLNIDVGRYFQEVPAIRVYRCLDTDYRFYAPLGIAADEAFYQELQRFNWYYPSWRWEYELSKRLISEKEKVLEIGCGNGAFLELMAAHGICAEGLETNEKARVIAQAKGLWVLNTTLQVYAETYAETADVVCAFQVLEHIAHVREFLASALKSLKKGGRLLVSVPDNGSVLRYDRFNALNLPPHHMGLWDAASLRNLAGTCGLSLLNLYYEEIEPAHIEKSGEAVYQWIEIRYGKAAATLCEFGGAALRKWVELLPGSVRGMTLLAEYRKE
jgi:2-polyprenyl-3-methyl-5-hydroxy-6-metoxy-1,4-benzoquinol methylase